MKRVTGIGGIFFKGSNVEELNKWYKNHLGIAINEYGTGDFEWRDKENPEIIGQTVWSIFAQDTTYFDPGNQSFMINYRVENLEELLKILREEGVKVEDKVEEADYGKFGWIYDPDGNKIELWEPPKGS
jgi:predicted enzyme related to lactoylglutathione lyase